MARRGITGVHKAEAVPVQAQADRAIVDVYCRKAGDLHATVDVDHVYLRVVESVHVDLGADRRQEADTRVGIPRIGLHLFLDFEAQ
jgi:hypothetical protein